MSAIVEMPDMVVGLVGARIEAALVGARIEAARRKTQSAEIKPRRIGRESENA